MEMLNSLEWQLPKLREKIKEQASEFQEKISDILEQLSNIKKYKADKTELHELRKNIESLQELQSQAGTRMENNFASFDKKVDDLDNRLIKNKQKIN